MAQSIGGGGFSALSGSGLNTLSSLGNSSQSSANAQTGQNIPSAITDSAQSAAYAGISSGRINAGTSVLSVRGISIGSVLGASGGSGNDGGSSSVTNNAWITTGGDSSKNSDGSIGIIAQSIGGGGLIDITTVGLNGGNFTVLATMGGSAPSNTSDASVSVNSSGAIITNGALADGILAQSIGGGGGSLGISHERVAATGLAYLSATLGSPAQPSDTTAGAVNVTVNSGSDINTYGFGSSAVTA